MTAGAPTIEYSLVVAPHTGFAEIDGALSAAGYQRGLDTSVTPPMIPGEPEFADWRCDASEALVNYSFNPVVGLRVLTFSGDDAAAAKQNIGGRLPCLDRDTLATLLQSDQPKSLLLGLYATAELKVIGLLPLVDALRVHGNQRVSRSAAHTAEKLSLALVAAGAEQLAAEQQQRPGHSVLFPRLGDAEVRRDTLLWLLHDRAQANEDMVKVLRAALEDPVWQVRITAMLVAGRFSVSELWLAIRRMSLPDAGQRDIDRRQRDLLTAVRKAVLAELANDPLPEPDGQAARFMLHLRDLVSGRSDGLAQDWDQGAAQWLAEFLRRPEADD